MYRGCDSTATNVINISNKKQCLYQLRTFNFEEGCATNQVRVQMGTKPGLDVKENYICLANKTPVI